MKRDQKGFTIVELLIAVAILSIVIAAVCGFILVGSRSYAAGNSDISVQQEAQLALNQMSDVLIDTTRSVNYAGYDTGGNAVHVLKDAEFTFTPEEKSLIMYNGVVEGDPNDPSTQTVAEGNGNKHYHFYWSKDDETLYYAELDVQPTDVDMTAISFPDPAAADPNADPALTEWYVLAQHVTDFSVDLSQVEEKRVVQLALTFLDGTKEYVTSNNVTIRNKVGVNDVELDPLNKKKTLSVTPRDSGVIIEPGEKYHFSTPKVTGENVADRSVTWSVVSSGSGETQFTDAANGILQVSEHEPAGEITVKIITNAVGSDGFPAECTLKVNIKRATEIKMAKTYDSDPGNSENRISPGCTFTITPNVVGNKLGEVCSACGSPDIDIDKAVGNKKNNTVYTWEILDVSAMPGDTSGWNPNKYIDIIEDEPDHATFYVHPDAVTCYIDEKTGKKTPYSAVIRCMSLLSVTDNDQGRHYDWWVPGAITVNFWEEEGEQAISYGQGLKYGEQTLDKSVVADLPTDYKEYVTAIRVVDNAKENPQPDRILLHYTIGHGADYRISPDLFDLDLNGSYTFYIQALFPIPEESYTPGQGGTPDDSETIKNEYFNNIKNNTAAQGYNGTRYRHSKVYYANLNKPRLTFKYKEQPYRGENITCDPFNIYTGDRAIQKFEPSEYENIERNNGMEGMVYSFYEGKGSSQSQWNKICCFNDESMSYEGSAKIEENGNTVIAKFADDAAWFSPGSDPFMMVPDQDRNKRLKVCGDYHIVPGMLYRNKLYDHYEIIAWQGFDLEAERETRYYEFEESTIHANVNADFTMDINDDWFRGQVNFPLPKEMIKNAALFPNPYDTEWKNTAGSLRVVALQTGGSGGYKTFAYVGYRYFPMLDRWEVEPFEVSFNTDTKKISTHSYGTYVCDRNGSKWEKSLTKGSSTTEKDMVCNVKPFSINDGNDYQAFFPLPTDAGFPFASGAGEIASYELAYFDNNMQSKGTLSGLTVICKKNGDEYEIEFLKEEGAPEWEPNNHKITVTSYGTYTCRKGQTAWTRKKGYSTSDKTDLVTNLEGLTIDGTSYKMYFPKPEDRDFPFNGQTEGEMSCTNAHIMYKTTDIYGENASTELSWHAKMKYKRDGDTHTIKFVCAWNETEEFGTFRWNAGEGKWEKVK